MEHESLKVFCNIMSIAGLTVMVWGIWQFLDELKKLMEK
jgi:hypothetical protein|tara:strand:+ start:570 stop:686 length:117 start_codon:yes stop_codon:yes gene_type:complete